jgi:nucleoside-diphosphate-sugar epimerase
MARVLVAGGAGFIGSSVSRRLIADGHSVVCLDNFSTGSRRNLADLEGDARFEFVEANVAHAPAVRADIILHLASPASPVDYGRFPLETMEANAQGTWRLLEVARQTRARLVYASTSEVYGDPMVHPQPETYWGNVDPIGPRACYDESKRFAEALLMSYRRVHGVNASICRLFNTYGPFMRRDDGRVIPEMISAAIADRSLPLHGDGRQTRSFCYVSDLVEGLLRVAFDASSDGQVFNIGNPAEISMRKLADEVVRLSGTAAPIVSVERRPGDPERRRPVITKMTERYGWQPQVDLEAGLRETIAWFRREAVSDTATTRSGQDPLQVRGPAA